MKKELIQTSDGSNTLYIPELNETYHSTHGALQESLHVFIKEGVGYCSSQRELNILEVGFGTGLNAFLTAIQAAQNKQLIKLTSLEAYPLSVDEMALLDYTSIESLKSYSKLYDDIIAAPWNKMQQITSLCYINKVEGRLQDFTQHEAFDLIYFDAFAPEKQPELWTQDIFEKMYRALKPKGVLVTYCAKGVVKRTIKSVGFELQSIPGPPGKREMTRAIKP